MGGNVDSETLKRADVTNDKEVNLSDINALIYIILK